MDSERAAMRKRSFCAEFNLARLDHNYTMSRGNPEMQPGGLAGGGGLEAGSQPKAAGWGLGTGGQRAPWASGTAGAGGWGLGLGTGWLGAGWGLGAEGCWAEAGGRAAGGAEAGGAGLGGAGGPGARQEPRAGSRGLRAGVKRLRGDWQRAWGWRAGPGGRGGLGAGTRLRHPRHTRTLRESLRTLANASRTLRERFSDDPWSTIGPLDPNL